MLAGSAEWLWGRRVAAPVRVAGEAERAGQGKAQARPGKTRFRTARWLHVYGGWRSGVIWLGAG